MRWPNRDLHNRVYAHISRLSPAWNPSALSLLLRHILCMEGPQLLIPNVGYHQCSTCREALSRAWHLKVYINPAIDFHGDREGKIELCLWKEIKSKQVRQMRNQLESMDVQKDAELPKHNALSTEIYLAIASMRLSIASSTSWKVTSSQINVRFMQVDGLGKPSVSPFTCSSVWWATGEQHRGWFLLWHWLRNSWLRDEVYL